MIDTKIVDGSGSGKQAIVTENGELVTRDFDYSDSNSVTLDAANTAFNLFGPISNANFIVTTIIVSTNKDITINGTLVEIYEADAVDDTTSTKDRLPLNMLKNTALPITGLLTKITTGKYLNVKHDDASPNAEVFVTVLGYYVPEIGTIVT